MRHGAANEHASLFAGKAPGLIVSKRLIAAYAEVRQSQAFAVLWGYTWYGRRGIVRAIMVFRAYSCSFAVIAVASCNANRAHCIRSRRAWRRNVHVLKFTIASARGARGLFLGVLVGQAFATTRSVVALIVFFVAAAPHSPLARIGAPAALPRCTVAAVWALIEKIHTSA
jgi:hypothetical protein